jgi:hypothetical protein
MYTSIYLCLAFLTLNSWFRSVTVSVPPKHSGSTRDQLLVLGTLHVYLIYISVLVIYITTYANVSYATSWLYMYGILHLEYMCACASTIHLMGMYHKVLPVYRDDLICTAICTVTYTRIHV